MWWHHSGAQVTGSNIFGKDRLLQRILSVIDLERSSERVIFVGDETRDIEAAKKVDINSIAVTWGFTAKEGLLKESPELILDNPRHLAEKIIELFKD